MLNTKWTFSPVLRCVHRTSASCTASSAGSPSPRRKRIKVQPPPWYDLCSSDQRLEPVRIQMLCRAAFFFLPHLDPQTMMSDPVLLPEDSFGLPDWFNQESFFPLSLKSKTAVSPVPPPHPPVHSSRIDGSSVFLFTVNFASMRSGVATGSYRGSLTLVWTDVSALPSDPFTYVILSRAII